MDAISISFDFSKTFNSLNTTVRSKQQKVYSFSFLISLPTEKNNTFADLAATHFNSLPGEIRDIQGEEGLQPFKTNVKHLLLTNQQNVNQ